MHPRTPRRGGNRSKFVESVIRPHINQLDLGESCETLERIDRTLKDEIISAVLHSDFEKTSTFAALGNCLGTIQVIDRSCRLPANTVTNDKQIGLSQSGKPFISNATGFDKKEQREDQRTR